jgi:hypothetical protein
VTALSHKKVSVLNFTHLRAYELRI